MAKPRRALSLRDYNPKVPLEDLILAATMDLDGAGEPGERYRAPKVPLEDPILAATTDLDSAGEPGGRDIGCQTIHPFSEVSVFTLR